MSVDACTATCGWLSAAPSLRFWYRLFLLVGATFVAFLIATGAAHAEADSAPAGEVSVSSGTESQPVAEPVSEPATEPATGVDRSVTTITPWVPVGLEKILRRAADIANERGNGYLGQEVLTLALLEEPAREYVQQVITG